MYALNFVDQIRYGELYYIVNSLYLELNIIC